MQRLCDSERGGRCGGSGGENKAAVLVLEAWRRHGGGGGLNRARRHGRRVGFLTGCVGLGRWAPAPHADAGGVPFL